MTLRVTLRNTGNRAGAEVAQVYANLPASSGEPPKRLVAWRKVMLAPGETRRVTIEVAPQRLAVWDVSAHRWRMPSGPVGLAVGTSSRDPAALGATVREDGGYL
ncbi:MAG: fibronectin type III-like domain-contianing protein [Paludibacterium sp.]|nr:fibronectin type III-like domain-contianing protein [Paludibacterium sp.]